MKKKIKVKKSKSVSDLYSLLEIKFDSLEKSNKKMFFEIASDFQHLNYIIDEVRAEITNLKGVMRHYEDLKKEPPKKLPEKNHPRNYVRSSEIDFKDDKPIGGLRGDWD